MRDLLLDALSTFRLTRLLVEDELLAEPRDAVTRWADSRDTTLRRKVGTLATCPWCMSAYSGLLAVALRSFAPRLWDPLAKALAYSAVAGLIASRED